MQLAQPKNLMKNRACLIGTPLVASRNSLLMRLNNYRYTRIAKHVVLMIYHYCYYRQRQVSQLHLMPSSFLSYQMVALTTLSPET